MDWLLQDFTYGVRFLRKRLGLTSIAVLVLGLGISLTSTMYAIIDAVILSGPDYDSVDRIVFLQTTIPQSQFNQSVRLHDYLDWRDQQSVFQEMSAHTGFAANLSGEEGPAQRYRGVRLTASTFDLLGVRPFMGRAFTPEDDFLIDQHIVILSYHVWEQRYASDPDIIGRTIRVNATPTTVIGVMPPGFRFPEMHDLWMPLGEDPGALGRREGPGLAVLGRMAPGVAIPEVRAQLTTIANRLAQEYPESNKEITPVVESWIDAQFVDDETKGILYTMFTAVVGVLLIACANVANLLLATTIARGKELAVRSALGAARIRVLRQLLSETLVLAAGGAALGLVLSKFSLDIFARVVVPLTPPPWMVFELRPGAFAFALGATAFSALASGMLPAFHATRVDLQSVLSDQARGSSSRNVGRWATALVVVEVALSCALLVGAGLMIRSTLAVGADDYGLDRSNILTADLGLPEGGAYADSTGRLAFTQRLDRELRALPGVREVAISSSLPILGTSYRFYGVRDHEYADDSEYAFSGHTRVTPGFFDLIGVPIVAGRDFRQTDVLGDDPVVIVDQRFADRNWPDADPIGKEVRLGRSDSENPWMTVIGVVRTFEMSPPLDFGSRLPEGMFVPILQDPVSGLSIMIKTDGASTALATPVRDLVARLDPDVPVTNVNSLESRVAEENMSFAIIGGMFLTFGVVALVLASIGLYAVMAFSVNRRTPEVGIRMALGANGGRIIRLILGQGAVPVGIGMVVGLGLAVLLGNALSTFLFKVSVIDPLTFAGIPVLLLAVSVVALLVPAFRAARVAPVIALRAE
jgi:putative ABC transport system permease protein